MTMGDLRSALKALSRGMRLAKCHKCGCMESALAAVAAAAGGDESASRRVAAWQAQMEPVAYACLGCRRCWGAEAQNAAGEEAAQTADVSRCDTTIGGHAWPAAAGEYVLGNDRASVAVCTLASANLVGPLMDLGREHIAIAGKCETENIGVEKLVLNMIGNPRLRTLILCGQDADGHRAGDALVQLIDEGVDADMRIAGASGRRPVLGNLTLAHVQRFREQVAPVDLVGQTDLDVIVAAARARDALGLPPLPDFDLASSVPVLLAHAPHRLRLDPGGFFIIIPERERRVIVCEHYHNDGRLAHLIEGEEAGLIAATVIEEGWVTQLDHAAYVGRELQKAQDALEHDLPYEQDSAPGKLDSADDTRRSADETVGVSSGGRACCCRGAACDP